MKIKFQSKKSKIYLPIFFYLMLLFSLITVYVITLSFFEKPKIPNYDNLNSAVKIFILKNNWFIKDSGSEKELNNVQNTIEWKKSQYIINITAYITIPILSKKIIRYINIKNPTLTNLINNILQSTNNNLWIISKIFPLPHEKN